MLKNGKRSFKFKIVPLFFLAVSLISISLAWFAYSGLAKVETEIDVKTWYIEFQKNGEAVSNNIVISLDEIYPGMDTVHESVKILNKGDTDAKLSYQIVSANILGEEKSVTDSSFEEDQLSQEYPFHINMNLSKVFAKSEGNYSMFDLSVSWPYESSHDDIDSEWGNKAFQFQQEQLEKSSREENYQVQPSIKVVISVKAEQYLEEGESRDIRFDTGDLILYDVSKHESCTQLSDTCIRTHVLDSNNLLSDQTVSLLPDFYGSYASGPYGDYQSLLSSSLPNWNVSRRGLTVQDILGIISSDVLSSQIVTPNLSDRIIGDVSYPTRPNQLLEQVTSSGAYFRYAHNSFTYLSTNSCIWTQSEYSGDMGFALTKIDDGHSKIYGENKNTSCMIIPVIVADKDTL